MPSSSHPSRRPPSLLALPSYLAGSVARLSNGRLVAVLAQHGLTLPHYAVLVALSDFGRLAPHDLATRLQVDRSHMSGSIDVLARRGFVSRTPHATDRRRLIVALTDSGAQLTADLATAAAETERWILAALDDHERQTLQALLLKVIVAADSPEPPVGGTDCVE